MAAEDIVIKSHPGPQTSFLSSPADTVWFGGSAGGALHRHLSS